MRRALVIGLAIAALTACGQSGSDGSSSPAADVGAAANDAAEAGGEAAADTAAAAGQAASDTAAAVGETAEQAKEELSK